MNKQSSVPSSLVENDATTPHLVELKGQPAAASQIDVEGFQRLLADIVKRLATTGTK